MNKLNTLRNELAVGKSRFNSFGKYNYRSQEDILNAVKPLLLKHELFMTVSDEMVMLGERFYVKATITIQEDDGLFAVTAIGYAREPENKKGMDESQITGTASSYARKYALNAMFLIDDTKDADTDEHHKQVDKAPYDINGSIKKMEKCKDLKTLGALWPKLYKEFTGTTEDMMELVKFKDIRKKELTPIQEELI